MTDNEQKRIFARNLTFYINKSGHTQKEIAQILGIKNTTLNNWCLAKAMPTMGTVQRVADYFGIRNIDLINERTKDDEEQILIEQYLKDDAIRRFVLYAGGSMPKESRDKFLEAMIQTYEATRG